MRNYYNADPNAFLYTNAEGIHLMTINGGSGLPSAQVCNRVSINMTPFKRMIIYGCSRYYRGDNWSQADMRVGLYKSDHKTRFRWTNRQRFDESVSAMVVDVSDINEHVYFLIDAQPMRDDAYPSGDVGFIITRIDFLTT